MTKTCSGSWKAAPPTKSRFCGTRKWRHKGYACCLVGFKFVQFQYNSAYHSEIKCSSYLAMFGYEARVALASLSLPSEVINAIDSEDDLAAIVGDSPTASTDNLITQNNTLILGVNLKKSFLIKLPHKLLKRIQPRSC